MTRHIVIIYEKMGMGHLRMARIIKDILHKDDVSVTLLAGSDVLGTTDITTTVWLWNFLVKKNWIRICDIVVNFAGRLLVLPLGEVTRFTPFSDYLDVIKPDIIISTADVYNRGLGIYAAQRGIPFYVVISEISVFMDLVSPHAAYLGYFGETARALRSYDFTTSYFTYELDQHASWLAKAGYVQRYWYDYLLKGLVNKTDSINRIPDHPLPDLNDVFYQAVGPLVEKHFFKVQDKAALKQKYGIGSADTVLVASGSLGGRFLLNIMRWLDKHNSQPLNLLFMCGHDRKAYEKIRAFRSSNPALNVMAFTYTEQFDEFLEMADCIILRPSAGIFMESLIKRTPVITFELALSNDKGSLTIIKKYGVGEICRSRRDLVRAINTVLNNKSLYQENIKKLLALYPLDWEAKSTLIRETIFRPEPHAVLKIAR